MAKRKFKIRSFVVDKSKSDELVETQTALAKSEQECKSLQRRLAAVEETAVRLRRSLVAQVEKQDYLHTFEQRRLTWRVQKQGKQDCNIQESSTEKQDFQLADIDYPDSFEEQRLAWWIYERERRRFVPFVDAEKEDFQVADRACPKSFEELRLQFYQAQTKQPHDEK